MKEECTDGVGFVVEEEIEVFLGEAFDGAKNPGRA